MRLIRARSCPLLLALVSAAIALGAAPSQAAVRYAAPGATGAAPCTEREHPCSLFVAADQTQGATSGDEIVLAPGTYVDDQGDMGPNGFIFLPTGVKIHGEEGAPRPLLAFVTPSGTLLVLPGDTVSYLRFFTARRGAPLVIAGGVVERVVSTSEGGAGACRIGGDAVLRDSVCLAEGPPGSAALIGDFSSGLGGNPRLRNVTAIASGDESFGIQVNAQSTTTQANVRVDAKSVIAEGTKDDVVASAVRGAAVQVSLDHSAYDKVDQVVDNLSTVTITAPGTGSNITEAAEFASDGFHQLAASPTVDHGAVDESSGLFDLDGRSRVIGPSPDIGADELALTTTAALSCVPGLFIIGSSSTCTMTVSNGISPVDPPRGEVFFESNGGHFASESCTLVEVSASKSECAVEFEADFPAAFLTLAEYPGDDQHLGSSDLTPLGSLPRAQRSGEVRVPQTRVRRLPKSAAKPGRTRFALLSDQPDARFECSLDREGYKRCKSPVAVTVRGGKHIFRARAISSEHVLDPSPAVVHWRAPGSRPRGRPVSAD